MSLPNSYTMKSGAISDYLDAILNAEAPERFSKAFLDGLGFTSSNDRLLIGILKELGFLNTDGAPKDRYYYFLDRSQSAKVLADGIRDAYADLFQVNTSAHEMNIDQTYNKLRTLYKGDKKDSVVKLIARTFVALCEQADFSQSSGPKLASKILEASSESKSSKNDGEEELKPGKSADQNNLKVDALQYHINIVLPDTRDQAVYDAIFKSLRDHLGR